MPETNESGTDSQSSRSDPIRWTIMLYIAADGNLANFAVESLKQLNHSITSHSGNSRENSVVVAAQFAIDAPAGQQIPRYIFDKCSWGSIKNSLAGYLHAPDNMTEQQALVSFLQWVYSNPKCAADKYVLILWGHGPELLLQPPAGAGLNDPCGDPNGVHPIYLTPQELRQALEEGFPAKLDIIGFDACSMSMAEVAYEIHRKADFMVASQEEVPDPSFPYDTLVEKFRSESDPRRLSVLGTFEYVRAYEDYICNANTGMKRVTLSALRLAHVDRIHRGLHRLACALWHARSDQSLPPLLIEARECAKDFVGGLYVDIYDFCDRLERLVEISEFPGHGMPAQGGEECRDPAAKAGWKPELVYACVKIKEALTEEYRNIESDAARKEQLILANSSVDKRCHGLSIYFPYLSSALYAEVQQPMVKGGYDTIGKGFSVVMNRAASNLLMCVRRQLIVDTEGYYATLKLSEKTGWYRFIAKQWALILAELYPEDLDQLYSAQQCAVNWSKQFPELEHLCRYEEKKEGQSEPEQRQISQHHGKT